MARTYAFELSGEHNTLPRSEALALIEIFSAGYREICSLEQCLVVEAEDLDYQATASRLAMTHSILEVSAICDSHLDALAYAVQNINVPKERYEIRARKVRDALLQTDKVEREVGRVLYRRGYQADLNNPKIKLRAIITSGKVVLGIELARPDRRGFEDRRPHLKPFFHPGVLMPRVARALVNISQTRHGEVLLDPFSGTGGILVEACLIGLRGIGIDIQRKLVRGAKANLVGLDCLAISGDARFLPLKEASIESAVLDMPYGRSALIRAESKEELLSKSFSELFRVLKPGRRMVVVTNSQINDFLAKAGFEIIETHAARVHRSLTRLFFICRKVN